jgi:hypothetical protein
MLIVMLIVVLPLQGETDMEVGLFFLKLKDRKEASESCPWALTVIYFETRSIF